MSIGLSHTIHARHRHFGWSRDNPPALIVAPGDTVEVEVVDSAGGEINPDTTAGELSNLDRSKFVPLTGPLTVEGAQPGDALEITFLDFVTSGWGWSAVTTRYGILADQFPEPLLKIWQYDRAWSHPAMFSDIAKVPLKPFPGTIGLARAEQGIHPSLPPYHTGGNLDVRDLSIGTALLLPVEVPGGLLSIGDTHAAQGQGELAGTALESPMSVVLKIELVRNARLHGPQFTTPGPVVRHLDELGYHVTCGLGSDLMEAARMAASQMIELLVRTHHVAPIDAYLLCSVCGDLVISELVNRPTHVVSLYFPRLVFE